MHIWLTVSGDYAPVFDRPRAANSNPLSHERILGRLTNQGHLVQWAVTTNRIGFLGIYGWNDPGIPGRCDEVLEEMRGTRALIVDVRLNGGGSEDLAREVAARFLDKPFVYAFDQRRNSSNHANLTEKSQRVVEPRGPWRYDRPVILLIGQKCMSSTESFVAMMSGDTNLTTMGDHTCGSSGNPEIIQLPLDMTVSVPQWIDYLPDGSLLDGRGFQPQILFAPKPGAFEGTRDDLLTAALECLRLEPLPDKPIPGDTSVPHVVSVFPPDGATSIEAVTQLRVQFDRQMNPAAVQVDWESGGFLDCGFPEYNAETHEFTISVQLAPGPHRIAVNSALPVVGSFRSQEGKSASRFVWQFDVKENPQPKTPVSPVAAPDKKEMLQTLEWMRQRQEEITSVEERVQTLYLQRRRNSYVQMSMEGISFKWQKPDRYFADARTGVALRQNYAIGCDGEDWRWFAQNVRRTNFIVCPVNEVTRPDISFCDPFNLMRKTPEQTATDLGLRFCGATNVGGSRRLLFERVNIDQVQGMRPTTNATQWLIDGDTGRLLETRSSVAGAFRSSPAVWRRQYVYDSVNLPLPKEAFTIPCPASVTPQTPHATNHVASVRDGSDSYMDISFDNSGIR